MEWLQLKYFQTVARLEHMTQAAEQLHIAQPSLSKTIARLEEAVGVALFDRQGRQIRLNQFGRVYLERVDPGLARGSIRLGVSITSVLPELIGPFIQQHPSVHFRQILGPTAEMIQRLEDGDIDLWISSVQAEGADLEWQALMTEQVWIAASSEHRLAERDSVTLEELANEPFISMNTGFSFRDLMDDLCRQADFKPNITFEVDEPDGIARLVGQGLGIAFMPELSFRARSRAGLKQLQIESRDFKRTTWIAWSRRHYLSLAAKQFREYIIESYRHMQRELYD